jgi:uncharacterized membrane protein YkvA (DUF1232 family)
MRLIDTLKHWAQRIKQDALTLWFCARHPETPRTAKVVALLLAAYAFSPIDLIPDFIPVLGFLDEMILLPVGIAFCLRLIPQSIIAECRQSADNWIEQKRGKPRSYVAAICIVLLWVLLLWPIGRWLIRPKA